MLNWVLPAIKVLVYAERVVKDRWSAGRREPLNYHIPHIQYMV